MSTSDRLRPYRAVFTARFLQSLQYRTAALAGFVTQCWWGGIKVMVLAAFYNAADPATRDAAMPLTQAITYTWLAQGLLALLPWSADPDVAQAVRSGAVAYDRLRPVDAYTLWYARSAGWIAARVLPRVAMMAGFAALLLPLAGLSDWAWQAPASVGAALLFVVSAVFAWLLSAAMVMLVNIACAAALNESGIDALTVPVVIALSGNLLPLALLPASWQTLLLLQPLAGLVDIPMRLYFGQLDAASTLGAFGALGVQCGWLVVLIGAGRLAMARTMNTLEVQGG